MIIVASSVPPLSLASVSFRSQRMAAGVLPIEAFPASLASPASFPLSHLPSPSIRLQSLLALMMKREERVRKEAPMEGLLRLTEGQGTNQESSQKSTASPSDGNWMNSTCLLLKRKLKKVMKTIEMVQEGPRWSPSTS